MVICIVQYRESYSNIVQCINIKDISLFQKFVKLCAGRIGGILNKESLVAYLLGLEDMTKLTC